MPTAGFSLLSRHLTMPIQSSAKSKTSLTLSAKPKTARRSGLTSRGKDVFNVVIPPDPIPKYSIDNFMSQKNSSLIKSKWNLDSEVLKGQNKVQENTDNMIEKLKNVFREQFESRLDERERVALERSRQKRLSMASIKEKTRKDTQKKFPGKENLRKKSLETTPRKVGSGGKKKGGDLIKKSSLLGKISLTSSNTKLIESVIDEMDIDDQQPLYLKKIKNNFYERKLWNSLEIENTGNQLNLHPETERDYTSEFSIIQRYDWTQSQFGKSKNSCM